MHNRQLRVLKFKYDGSSTGCRLVMLVDAIPKAAIESYDDGAT